jgi:light-regulated signal transduction histidine kinase (bacteriophytochrome)
MKPLLPETEDKQSLQALGRASVQIVHDLKNQLNGLKLYATFLRKRLEKNERAADELETINKLIRGLDRTAEDLSMIVEFGQPLHLRKQAGIDLQKMLRGVATGLNESPRVSGALAVPIVIDSEATSLVGEFDPAVLGDAFKSISLVVMKVLSHKTSEQSLHIRAEPSEDKKDGMIEWRGFDSLDHDPFHSFAGSDEIRMSLAAKVVEAHGGSAEQLNGCLRVRLPLASQVVQERRQDQ